MPISTAIAGHPHVVAVVLNWNGPDETLACVESLAASAWPRLTTVVVDNASLNDITPVMSQRFPHVLVIRNSANLGFTGGMNVGIRHALEMGADYALLLNNDTLVEPGMVATLVATAAEHPTAGIVSPLVLYRDRPDVIFSAGLRCDLRRGYQGAPIGNGEGDRGQFGSLLEVDAPAGAAMLVPAHAIRKVGLLDEDLFLYGEDVEWATRMKTAGLHVYVAPMARLWHGLSVSSGGANSPLSAYYLTRNSFVVCQRHSPLRGPRAIVRAADILLGNLYHARRAPNPLLNVRAVLAGWRDYMHGRLGPRRSGPLAHYGAESL